MYGELKAQTSGVRIIVKMCLWATGNRLHADNTSITGTSFMHYGLSLGCIATTRLIRYAVTFLFLKKMEASTMVIPSYSDCQWCRSFVIGGRIECFVIDGFPSK